MKKHIFLTFDVEKGTAILREKYEKTDKPTIRVTLDDDNIPVKSGIVPEHGIFKPRFVLTPEDMFAIPTIQCWMAMAEAAGASKEKMISAEAVVTGMRNYKCNKKVPD